VIKNEAFLVALLFNFLLANDLHEGFRVLMFAFFVIFWRLECMVTIRVDCVFVLNVSLGLWMVAMVVSFLWWQERFKVWCVWSGFCCRNKWRWYV